MSKNSRGASTDKAGRMHEFCMVDCFNHYRNSNNDLQAVEAMANATFFTNPNTSVQTTITNNKDLFDVIWADSKVASLVALDYIRKYHGDLNHFEHTKGNKGGADAIVGQIGVISSGDIFYRVEQHSEWMALSLKYSGPKEKERKDSNLIKIFHPAPSTLSKIISDFWYRYSGGEEAGDLTLGFDEVHARMRKEQSKIYKEHYLFFAGLFGDKYRYTDHIDSNGKRRSCFFNPEEEDALNLPAMSYLRDMIRNKKDDWEKIEKVYKKLLAISLVRKVGIAGLYFPYIRSMIVDWSDRGSTEDLYRRFCNLSYVGDPAGIEALIVDTKNQKDYAASVNLWEVRSGIDKYLAETPAIIMADEIDASTFKIGKYLTFTVDLRVGSDAGGIHFQVDRKILTDIGDF